MKSVWQFLPPASSEKIFGKHPTQKPIALLKRIIRASTKTGDIVFDPFMGSTRREDMISIENSGAMTGTQAMLIKLRVHPGAKAASLIKKSDDAFEVSVRAPAEGGRANREALPLLAKALGLDVRRLHIVKGTASPHKIVKLFGTR